MLTFASLRPLATPICTLGSIYLEGLLRLSRSMLPHFLAILESNVAVRGCACTVRQCQCDSTYTYSSSLDCHLRGAFGLRQHKCPFYLMPRDSRGSPTCLLTPAPSTQEADWSSLLLLLLSMTAPCSCPKQPPGDWPRARRQRRRLQLGRHCFQVANQTELWTALRGVREGGRGALCTAQSHTSAISMRDSPWSQLSISLLLRRILGSAN